MTHTIKIISFILILALAACGKKSAQAPVTKSAETPQAATAPAAAPANPVAAAPVAADPNKTAEFDVTSVPITTKDLGKFPYINAPERFKHDRGDTSDLGREYFAINGKLVPKEGKKFKAYIEPIDSSRDRNNNLLLEKSYQDGLIALGAVETSKGVPIKNSELERIGDDELIKRHYGETIDYNGLDRIKTFLIRTSNQEIWIQYTIYSYQASGKIVILQVEKPKSLAITTISAEGIEKDLAASGKAVLQINFDTDKATLKADGKDAVNQIKQVLQNNAALKLALNGYTDNVGDAKHNAELSNARANAVLDALVSAGIAKSRLTAAGFGDKNPIADNSTEAGKAKNRRVELIKQ